MPGIVVVGAQFGDEGKGKIVTYLAREIRSIVRFAGGANAGHTVFMNGEKYVHHLLPCGGMYDRRYLYLGPGMAIDPETLVQEITAMHGVGGFQNGAICIDLNAHVVLPTHKEIDKERNKHLGTTGRGIGPCYEDRVGRRGIRIRDLLADEPSYYQEAMSELLTMDFVRFVDTGELVRASLENGALVLFEGAQGVLLDVDFGTYPFVTSSHTLPQNVALSMGLPMKYFSRVIGVTKAYTTRVGEGPFPTELKDETGERIRQAGNEYGATTGRPRRSGWLDVAALRYAIRVSGIDVLAITKLDVLTDFPEIKICVGYKVGNVTYNELSLRNTELDKVAPIYETLPGWKYFKDTKYFCELPSEVRRFIARLEELVGVSVLIISTGADTDSTIIRDARKVFLID